MSKGKIFAAIFTVLAIANFSIAGLDSVVGWALMIIANIHEASSE